MTSLNPLEKYRCNPKRASVSEALVLFNYNHVDKSLLVHPIIQLSKIYAYDKLDNLDFDIIMFPYLDSDVPCRPSYGVYISQLIRFARVCSHAVDFNARNKCLTATLPKQRYRWHKLRKAFSKFYHRHHESGKPSEKALD